MQNFKQKVLACLLSVVLITVGGGQQVHAAVSDNVESAGIELLLGTPCTDGTTVFSLLEQIVSLVTSMSGTVGAINAKLDTQASTLNTIVAKVDEVKDMNESALGYAVNYNLTYNNYDDIVKLHAVLTYIDTSNKSRTISSLDNASGTVFVRQGSTVQVTEYMVVNTRPLGIGFAVCVYTGYPNYWNDHGHYYSGTSVLRTITDSVTKDTTISMRRTVAGGFICSQNDLKCYHLE